MLVKIVPKKTHTMCSKGKKLCTLVTGLANIKLARITIDFLW